MNNVILDVSNDINDKIEGGLNNLAYFAIGIGIGIVLFCLVFLIFYLISSSKRKVSKHIKKEVIINEKYKEIINENQELYKSTYKNAPIKEKALGLLKILYDMLERISILYYPKSDDSIFEISLNQLVDLLDYVTKRINYIVDSLLEGKFQLIDKLSKNSLKDKKLGFVYNFVFKKKEEQEEVVDEEKPVEKKKKKGFFKKVITKVATKIGGNLMNSEFDTLIVDLGEDINKLYSGQDLVFTDLTKKQRKNKEKLDKLSNTIEELPKDGDSND